MIEFLKGIPGLFNVVGGFSLSSVWIKDILYFLRREKGIALNGKGLDIECGCLFSPAFAVRRRLSIQAWAQPQYKEKKDDSKNTQIRPGVEQ
jgi:hypothetical protein